MLKEHIAGGRISNETAVREGHSSEFLANHLFDGGSNTETFFVLLFVAVAVVVVMTPSPRPQSLSGLALTPHRVRQREARAQWQIIRPQRMV